MSENSAFFPSSATAGVTFNASLDLPDYPAGIWSLVAFIRGPGQIDLIAAADGATHKFTAAATATADWLPGRYAFTLRASYGGETFEAGRGTFDVLPDLATVVTPFDGRSDNERALDAIDAVLGKRATIDQERYRINNRELWRTPIAELMKLQAFYKMRVRRERARAKGVNEFGRQIQVRFS